jgi:hypothetical protein
VNSELNDLAARWMSIPKVTGVAIANMLPGQTSHMTCVASYGWSAPPVGTFLDVNLGISGRCIRESRTLHSYDTRLDPRVDRGACESLGIRSLAIAPLYREGRCIGILEVFSDQCGTFEEHTLRELEQDALLAAAFCDVETESLELNLQEVFSGLDPFDPLTKEILGADVQSSRLTPPENTATKPAQPATVTELASANAPQFLSAYSETGSRYRRVASFLMLAGLGVLIPMVIHRIDAVEARTSSTVAANVIEGAPALSPTNASPVATVMKTELETDANTKVRALTTKAQSGDVAAQVSLAKHYARGDGVDMDKIKAAAWYIVAGVNGNTQSKEAAVKMTHELSRFEIAQVRFDVGRMFRDGIGSSPDPILAYSWFVLAGAAGDVRAKGEQQKLEQTMRPSELLKARDRAAAWISSHSLQRSSATNTVAAVAR